MIARLFVAFSASRNLRGLEDEGRALDPRGVVFAVAPGAGGILARGHRGQGDAGVESVFLGGVLVTRHAVHGNHGLEMRRALTVKFLMAIDAFQRAVGGLRGDFLVDKEEQLLARLFHRELLVAMAFEARRGGVRRGRNGLRRIGGKNRDYDGQP